MWRRRLPNEEREPRRSSQNKSVHIVYRQQELLLAYSEGTSQTDARVKNVTLASGLRRREACLRSKPEFDGSLPPTLVAVADGMPYKCKRAVNPC